MSDRRRINNCSCIRERVKWLVLGVCFSPANFYFLPGQLDALLCGNSSDSGWVAFSALLQMPLILYCSSSVCLKSDYMTSKMCWVIFGLGAPLSLSLFFSLARFLHPLAAARRATHAWKLGGIQTTATPALTVSAGPSWLSSDSWHRTSGKTFTCW